MNFVLAWMCFAFVAFVVLALIAVGED